MSFPKTCNCCKGHGHIRANIPNHGTREIVSSIVDCPIPACVNGQITEASSKAYAETWETNKMRNERISRENKTNKIFALDK